MSTSLQKELKDLAVSLQVVVAHLAEFDLQIPGKEAVLRSLDGRIDEIKKAQQAEQAKVGTLLASVSEDAARVRHSAELLMEQAHALMTEAKAAKAQAESTIQEAKQRSAKLEADERFHNTQVQLFERKKAALNQALGQ